MQAELECDLLHITVAAQDRPQYEAISYPWNGQKPSGAHYILRRNDNGMRRGMHVTEHGEAVLRHLRLQHRGMFLWLDSVCVDQNSTVEPNFHMRCVYTFAERVVVRLGNTLTQGSERTLGSMRQIAKLDLDDDGEKSRLQSQCAQAREGQR
jgi:hypothetical protein